MGVGAASRDEMIRTRLLLDHVADDATCFSCLLLADEACSHRDRAAIVLDAEPLDMRVCGDALGLDR